MGNCCILNRIRNIRTMDISQIKDRKEKDKIIQLKKQYALKKSKLVNLTQEQKESQEKLLKEIGIIS